MVWHNDIICGVDDMLCKAFKFVTREDVQKYDPDLP